MIKEFSAILQGQKYPLSLSECINNRQLKIDTRTQYYLKCKFDLWEIKRVLIGQKR